MKQETGKFTFEVPSDSEHPDAGKQFSRTFDYQVCESDEEAARELARRKWTLASLVNAKVKNAERQASYQNALAPYARKSVSSDDARRAMVRNLIAAGMTESRAIEIANQAVSELDTAE